MNRFVPIIGGCLVELLALLEAMDSKHLSPAMKKKQKYKAISVNCCSDAWKRDICDKWLEYTFLIQISKITSKSEKIIQVTLFLFCFLLFIFASK